LPSSAISSLTLDAALSVKMIGSAIILPPKIY
jgi:hypothetical protein